MQIAHMRPESKRQNLMMEIELLSIYLFILCIYFIYLVS